VHQRHHQTHARRAEQMYVKPFVQPTMLTILRKRRSQDDRRIVIIVNNGRFSPVVGSAF
jgi:hypothetical protein